MNVFPLPSAHHHSAFSRSVLCGKHQSTAYASRPWLAVSLNALSDPDHPTSSSSCTGDIRRPSINIPLRLSPSSSNSSNSSHPKNPLKGIAKPTNSPELGAKLWLTSKLCPPPPPPSAPAPLPSTSQPRLKSVEDLECEEKNDQPAFQITQFRQEGKVFVGNLPRWTKKHEVAELFRQFGPIKNVILIKGHDDIEKNLGFGFVIYDGTTASKSAMKAVEFDGVEFHGRLLTVRLDDGRKMKEKLDERSRWVEGEDDSEPKSQWHEVRENSRKNLRKVLDTQPENWQAVVKAFEKIQKVFPSANLICIE